MKVIILAGGKGSRLTDSPRAQAKPMVRIADRPLLWHIFQHYSHHGFNDFIVALGEHAQAIKQYILDFHKLDADFRINIRDLSYSRHDDSLPVPWRVQLVETGVWTESGGRIKRLAEHVGNETFMLTYGDCVSDVPIDQLLQYHRRHGRLATVTAVRPPARFGHLDLDGEMVSQFTQQSQTNAGWINGGFFVLEPQVLQHIPGDATWFERETLRSIAELRQLVAYKHEGFWQCVDAPRHQDLLERLVASDQAPWLHGTRARRIA